VFSFWNFNIDTATAIAVGSRLFVYVRNSKGQVWNLWSSKLSSVSVW